MNSLNIVQLISDCGIPNAIKNGTIEASGQTTYLSVATVECDTGFDKSDETVICQADGDWDNASCIIRGINKTIPHTYSSFL